MVRNVVLLGMLPTPNLYDIYTIYQKMHKTVRLIYRMYLDRSFFFRRSPSASDISCSVTVYVYFSPFSKATLACMQQAKCLI